MTTVDLSIDFDFFVREEGIWDWGHNEEGPVDFANMIWQIRYRSPAFNMFREMDPARFAGVRPVHFLSMLFKKGLNVVTTGPEMKHRHLGIANSHRHAFDFFNKFTPADVVINFDAHHDIYKSADTPLDCGNWVSHLYKQWTKTEFHQVYPKWRDPNIDPIGCDEHEPYVPLNVHHWPIWSGLPSGSYLRHIFICLSPVWSPPHLDNQFISLVKLARNLVYDNVNLIEPIYQRAYPSLKQHKMDVANTHKQWEELRQLNLKQFARSEDNT